MTQTSYGRLRSVVLGLVVLGAVAFLVTLVPGVRGGPTFNTLYDGVLQTVAYSLMAVSALLPAILRTEERWFWSLIAAAMVLRALGFGLYLSWIRSMVPQPYPSLSDLCWVLSALALLAAVIGVYGRVRPGLTRLVVLDALIAGLTAAAFASALVHPLLERAVRGPAPTRVVLTNLTYPIIDLALVLLVVGLIFILKLSSSLALRMVFVGVVGFAVIDSVFLYEVLAGTWHPGSWVAGLSMVATALIATAGWFGRRTVEVDEAVAGLRHAPVELPIVLAVLCTGIFAFDAYRELMPATMLLAAAAMLLTILRGARTFSTDRRESRRALRVTDDERMKFQALVETSGDFIAIAGLDGKVAYVNPAGRAMVHMSPRTDVRKTTIVDYLTEEGVKASLEVEQPAVVANGRWEGESSLKDQRTGEAIPVAISSFLMNDPRTGEPMALATVQRDISARLAAERELAELAEQRQRLMARLVRAEEAERSRIAADVHDDSVQALAVVDLRLGMLRAALADAPAEQAQALDGLHESVTQAIGRLRELLFDLEPPGGGVELDSALSDAAAHLFQGTGIAWRVTGDGGPEIAESTRVTAYRIAKEAMVNVLKHADAGRVEIRVEASSEEGGVRVSVIDDGRGFGEEARAGRKGHLGLGSMADRAAIAGGRLDVESAPGQGTTVTLWLPDTDSETDAD